MTYQSTGQLLAVSDCYGCNTTHTLCFHIGIHKVLLEEFARAVDGAKAISYSHALSIELLHCQSGPSGCPSPFHMLHAIMPAYITPWKEDRIAHWAILTFSWAECACIMVGLSVDFETVWASSRNLQYHEKACT